MSPSIFTEPVHQPVQGFDYAKQHLGQQGGDEETLPVSQDTLVMSLQIRDTPLSLEKALQQDGTANKKNLTSDKHKRYHYIYTYSPAHAIICITKNVKKDQTFNFINHNSEIIFTFSGTQI